jgi:hypothetical protein
MTSRGEMTTLQRLVSYNDQHLAEPAHVAGGVSRYGRADSAPDAISRRHLHQEH